MSDYQEMLDPHAFTTFRRGWQTKIRIKHLLSNEDDIPVEKITEKGKTIAAKLKQCSMFANDSDGEDIIARFEGVDDLDEFNGLLEEMYDLCDSLRIWVE